ncbi:DUF3667 domain-containing protein [Lysobacter tyrosinilyticus]
MSEGIAQNTPAKCENCGTPLLGHYCYECGQSVHSPTRHFGHAVEELFESFWHLDGRVFRSLRDLMVPGRIAINYLAGQRARYLPPVRLFLILSVLTFFVARLTIDLDNNAFKFNGNSFNNLQTEAEVVALRNETLKELEGEEREAHKEAGVNAGLIATRARIEGAAASRIDDLRRRQKTGATGAVSPAPAASKGDANPPAIGEEGSVSFTANGKPWNEQTNPYRISWLPGFVNRWLNHKVARAEVNIRHMQGEPSAYLEAVLGALPTSLFLLMPVFALLLKVCYLGTGRRYLEHLVVALYSHAFLLIAMLTLLLLSSLSDLSSWLDKPTALVMAGVWLWVPAWLFLTQKRVYGEIWILAAIRYLIIGVIYTVLVMIASIGAVLAGITH